MKKVVRLTESDLIRLVNKVIKENEILTEADSAVMMVKNMPSNANMAGQIVNKTMNKLTKVKVRTSLGEGSVYLYRDLNDFSPSANFAKSGLLNKNVLGYAFSINGKSNTLFGYRDWGTLKKDFVLVYIPQGDYKTGMFGNLDPSKFVGWNYVWTSDIAIM